MADPTVIDMDIIKTIESNNNPNAVSPAGAIGLYQIMPITLEDYNQMNKKKYTAEQLFNPQVNKNIAEWYITKRIPQMLKHYKLPVNTNSILHAYNAGIGNVVKGVLPKETKNYLTKYNQLMATRATGVPSIR